MNFNLDNPMDYNLKLRLLVIIYFNLDNPMDYNLKLRLAKVRTVATMTLKMKEERILTNGKIQVDPRRIRQSRSKL